MLAAHEEPRRPDDGRPGALTGASSIDGFAIIAAGGHCEGPRGRRRDNGPRACNERLEAHVRWG
eukprot:1740160-Alexandrium_andersonii.AAC.1